MRATSDAETDDEMAQRAGAVHAGSQEAGASAKSDGEVTVPQSLQRFGARAKTRLVRPLKGRRFNRQKSPGRSALSPSRILSKRRASLICRTLRASWAAPFFWGTGALTPVHCRSVLVIRNPPSIATRAARTWRCGWTFLGVRLATFRSRSALPAPLSHDARRIRNFALAWTTRERRERSRLSPQLGRSERSSARRRKARAFPRTYNEETKDWRP